MIRLVVDIRQRCLYNNIHKFQHNMIVSVCWILVIIMTSTITAFQGIIGNNNNNNNNVMFVNRYQSSSSSLMKVSKDHLVSCHNKINRNKNGKSTTSLLLSTTNNRRMGELTSQEDIVYQFLSNVSKSLYAFRVIVVGKEDGSTILESTMNPFGSVIKITQSPSKGTNLMTMASNDQSFEFHVNLSKVTKIILIEKETPSKTLRIIRLMNSSNDNDNTETTLASLILATSSNDAYEWFTNDLIGKYGNEIITTTTTTTTTTA